MRTYKIPEFGIVVRTFEEREGRSGEIDSELKRHLIGEEPTSMDFELQGCINALEALVLAHACNGVDVGAPAYTRGLHDCIEAITNNVF